MTFLGRLDGASEWKTLGRMEALAKSDAFGPISIVPGTNIAYALRDDGDVKALWKLDLEGRTEPEVVFSHPPYDIGSLQFARDGRLLGVHYQRDKPATDYLDPDSVELMREINQAFPNRANRIIDMSTDRRACIVYSDSDVFSPAYLVAERIDGKLRTTQIGLEAPGLHGRKLSPMKSVEIVARDDVWIPGYLTLPVDSASPPPMIVMPHDGPYSRDVWGFDPMVQFFAARGYAVLQPNFRGSAGFGWAWLAAGLRDWGGLPYTDIVDATRWAIDRGYADAGKICIVGTGFGGYLAQLAATDNGKLFRCAASVAGVSSLVELSWEMDSRVAEQALGTRHAALKAASPRYRVASLGIPLLLIHGTIDNEVGIDQTRNMAAALKEAGKHADFVYIDGADHDFQEDAHARQLLGTLAAFLDSHLQAKMPDARN